MDSRQQRLKRKTVYNPLTLTSGPLVLHAILNASVHRWRALTNQPTRKEPLSTSASVGMPEHVGSQRGGYVDPSCDTLDK